jgi:single-stranded DNA-binding protein
MNSFTVIGTIKEAPELNKFGNSDCLSFNVIDIETYTYNGETKTRENRIPIKVWGKDAEKYSKHLESGMLVAIKGRLNIINKKQQDDSWKTFIEVKPDLGSGIEILEHPEIQRGERVRAEVVEGDVPF